MRGEGKFLLALGRLARGSVDVELAVSQHLLTFACRLVVADVGKGALQAFGEPLHHLVAVARALAVLVLHMVAVEGVKGDLVVRRFCPRHIGGKCVGHHGSDEQYAQHQRRYSLDYAAFLL